MDRFGLKEIEQPLHTYRHTDFSSRLDRVYVSYDWSEVDAAAPFCHRLPSRDSTSLKAFHYPLHFGIQIRRMAGVSSAIPPWVTAIPEWHNMVINSYRQPITQGGKVPGPFQKLELLKESQHWATSQMLLLLRKEMIPPADLKGPLPILQAMLIACDRRNSARLLALARLVPGLDAKALAGISITHARRAVEDQIHRCEQAAMEEEAQSENAHNPPEAEPTKELYKEHFFKKLARLIPTGGKSIRALQLEGGLAHTQDDIEVGLAKYWEKLLPAFPFMMRVRTHFGGGPRKWGTLFTFLLRLHHGTQTPWILPSRLPVPLPRAPMGSHMRPTAAVSFPPKS